ncbi:D-isomer specific 2-hydroxyacid dehydrogenase family protein [Marinifilum sp. D714]|uniref:NAD(P)-dependent oxidoreductase n=1 Tax=Marinifilum sp. D714 TaxID=2937523 RepID=UPI0027CB6686|nr:NAD(P)-dependent oxidoreductase [Marinifilum sp. D714]MDQ2178546.1 NAD(P)-binding domain-containing protein [Marinifilum sp. D714]
MILTDSKQILNNIADTLFISPQNINRFKDNNKIQIIVGSRALIGQCQNISFPNLKFIQLLSVGFEGIDIEKFKQKGVIVSNAANVYNVGMAEFIVYSLLMGAKRYNKGIRNSFIRYQRGYKYITELGGKTVGIMGVGAIGKEVAKRLQGFDMNVIGYDLTSTNVPNFEKVYAIEEKNEFLPQCDYLVVSIPLNDKTKGTLDQSVFEKLKPNVTIVNVGRKDLFNQNDFLKALKGNKEMTAILDMFELIPNPFTNPFRRLSNVKILPGVTAISKEINSKRLKLVRENIELVLIGETPKFAL